MINLLFSTRIFVSMKRTLPLLAVSLLVFATACNNKAETPTATDAPEVNPENHVEPSQPAEVVPQLRLLGSQAGTVGVTALWKPRLFSGYRPSDRRRSPEGFHGLLVGK